MSFEDFKNQLNTVLESRGYRVLEKSVTKTNQTLCAFSLLKADDDEQIVPVFYYSDIYSDVGIRTIEEIADGIEAKNVSKIEFSDVLGLLRDFDSIKGKIFAVLVNKEKNTALLKESAHLCFLDLALIFKILLREEENETATVTVTNEMLKAWDVIVEDLFEVACNNNVNGVSKVSSMLSVLEEMGFSDDFCGEYKENMLYVVSNEKKMFGASVIYTDSNVLFDFAEKVKSDIVILPSSIHEVLILSLSENMEAEFFRSMVKDVNEHELAISEYLSDTVYVYRRETRQIEIFE